MLQAGCHDDNSTNCQVGRVITQSDFKNLYPIFCFDVYKRDVNVFTDATASRLTIEGLCSAAAKRLVAIVEVEHDTTCLIASWRKGRYSESLSQKK